MHIGSIEPITWTTMIPERREFPCFCCHNGDATHFITAEMDGIDAHILKMPVCDKCAEYAGSNPVWLEEMLFLRHPWAKTKTPRW